MSVEILPETVDKPVAAVDKPVRTLCPTIACDKNDKPQVQILHSSMAPFMDAFREGDLVEGKHKPRNTGWN